MWCREVGKLIAHLPSVTGTLKERKGPQTLSPEKQKMRGFTSAEEIFVGVGAENEGMGGAGG
jgi:hypothetical protein